MLYWYTYYTHYRYVVELASRIVKKAETTMANMYSLYIANSNTVIANSVCSCQEGKRIILRLLNVVCRAA
jgi:hypothetical protein